MGKALTKEIVISNTNGLHIRPATLFVQEAMRFSSDVEVENLETSQKSDGKSVMGMLMLAAPKGTALRLAITGADAPSAMDSLINLISRGFDED